MSWGNNNNWNNPTNNTGWNPNQGGFNPYQGGFNTGGFNPTNPTNPGMNTNAMNPYGMNPGMNTNAMGMNVPYGMNTNAMGMNTMNNMGMNTNAMNMGNPYNTGYNWKNPYNLTISTIQFMPGCRKCRGTGIVMRRGDPFPCRRCYKRAGFCHRCYGTRRNYFSGEMCGACDNGSYRRRHSRGHGRRHQRHNSSSSSDSDW